MCSLTILWLMQALGLPPNERNSRQLDIICTALRMFPILTGVPDKVIREVAK